MFSKSNFDVSESENLFQFSAVSEKKTRNHMCEKPSEYVQRNYANYHDSTKISAVNNKCGRKDRDSCNFLNDSGIYTNKLSSLSIGKSEMSKGCQNSSEFDISNALVSKQTTPVLESFNALEKIKNHNIGEKTSKYMKSNEETDHNPIKVSAVKNKFMRKHKDSCNFLDDSGIYTNTLSGLSISKSEMSKGCQSTVDFKVSSKQTTPIFESFSALEKRKIENHNVCEKPSKYMQSIEEIDHNPTKVSAVKNKFIRKDRDPCNFLNDSGIDSNKLSSLCIAEFEMSKGWQSTRKFDINNTVDFEVPRSTSKQSTSVLVYPSDLNDRECNNDYREDKHINGIKDTSLDYKDVISNTFNIENGNEGDINYIQDILSDNEDKFSSTTFDVENVKECDRNDIQYISSDSEDALSSKTFNIDKVDDALSSKTFNIDKVDENKDINDIEITRTIKNLNLNNDRNCDEDRYISGVSSSDESVISDKNLTFTIEEDNGNQEALKVYNEEEINENNVANSLGPSEIKEYGVFKDQRVIDKHFKYPNDLSKYADSKKNNHSPSNLWFKKDRRKNDSSFITEELNKKCRKFLKNSGHELFGLSQHPGSKGLSSKRKLSFEVSEESRDKFKTVKSFDDFSKNGNSDINKNTAEEMNTAHKELFKNSNHESIHFLHCSGSKGLFSKRKLSSEHSEKSPKKSKTGQIFENNLTFLSKKPKSIVFYKNSTKESKIEDISARTNKIPEENNESYENKHENLEKIISSLSSMAKTSNRPNISSDQEVTNNITFRSREILNGNQNFKDLSPNNLKADQKQNISMNFLRANNTKHKSPGKIADHCEYLANNISKQLNLECLPSDREIRFHHSSNSHFSPDKELSKQKIQKSVTRSQTIDNSENDCISSFTNLKENKMENISKKNIKRKHQPHKNQKNKSDYFKYQAINLSRQTDWKGISSDPELLIQPSPERDHPSSRVSLKSKSKKHLKKYDTDNDCICLSPNLNEQAKEGISKKLTEKNNKRKSRRKEHSHFKHHTINMSKQSNMDICSHDQFQSNMEDISSDQEISVCNSLKRHNSPIDLPRQANIEGTFPDQELSVRCTSKKDISLINTSRQSNMEGISPDQELSVGHSPKRHISPINMSRQTNIEGIFPDQELSVRCTSKKDISLINTPRQSNVEGISPDQELSARYLPKGKIFPNRELIGQQSEKQFKNFNYLDDLVPSSANLNKRKKNNMSRKTFKKNKQQHRNVEKKLHHSYHPNAANAFRPSNLEGVPPDLELSFHNLSKSNLSPNSSFSKGRFAASLSKLKTCCDLNDDCSLSPKEGVRPDLELSFHNLSKSNLSPNSSFSKERFVASLNKLKTCCDLDDDCSLSPKEGVPPDLELSFHNLSKSNLSPNSSFSKERFVASLNKLKTCCDLDDDCSLSHNKQFQKSLKISKICCDSNNGSSSSNKQQSPIALKKSQIYYGSDNDFSSLYSKKYEKEAISKISNQEKNQKHEIIENNHLYSEYYTVNPSPDQELSLSYSSQNKLSPDQEQTVRQSQKSCENSEIGQSSDVDYVSSSSNLKKNVGEYISRSSVSEKNQNTVENNRWNSVYNKMNAIHLFNLDCNSPDRELSVQHASTQEELRCEDSGKNHGHTKLRNISINNVNEEDECASKQTKRITGILNSAKNSTINDDKSGEDYENNHGRTKLSNTSINNVNEEDEYASEQTKRVVRFSNDAKNSAISDENSEPNSNTFTNSQRRSSRQRYAPLAHWRNERLKYKFAKGGAIKILGIDRGTKEDNSTSLGISLKNAQGKKKRIPHKKSNVQLKHSKKFKLHDDVYDKSTEVELLKTFPLVPWKEENQNYRMKAVFFTKMVLYGFLEIDGLKSKEISYLKDDDVHMTVVNGRFEVTIQDDKVIACKKDMFLVPRKTPYSIKNLMKTKGLLVFSVGKIE